MGRDLALLAVVSVLRASLVFLNKQDAAEVGRKGVEYRLAPFGRLPYGHEVWGELVFDGRDGCSAFSLRKDLRESEFSVFLVLSAGGCNLKLKALNAERAGAQLLIVSVTDQNEADRLIVESNGSATVPGDLATLLVLNSEIEPLRARNLKSKELLMKFQMPMPRSDAVSVEFYSIPGDERFLSFVNSFGEHSARFGAAMRASLVLLKSNDANDANIDQMNRILACTNQAILLPLIGAFGQFCAAKGDLRPACLQGQLDAFDNKYIAEARRCVQRGINVTPLHSSPHTISTQFPKSFVYINGKLFHGSLKPENLFEAVCGGFAHAPAYCLYLNNRYTPNTHYHAIKERVRRSRLVAVLANIVFALFLLTVVGIAIFLIYEKLYRQLLDARTAEIVRQSVVDYQAIKNNE